MLIQPGITHAFIEVPLKDNGQEDTRSFAVEIAYAPFPFVRSRATVTIAAPIAVISDPARVRVPAGAHAPLVLSLSSPRNEALTVALSSSDRTVANTFGCQALTLSSKYCAGVTPSVRLNEAMNSGA